MGTRLQTAGLKPQSQTTNYVASFPGSPRTRIVQAYNFNIAFRSGEAWERGYKLQTPDLCIYEQDPDL